MDTSPPSFEHMDPGAIIQTLRGTGTSVEGVQAWARGLHEPGRNTLIACTAQALIESYVQEHWDPFGFAETMQTISRWVLHDLLEPARLLEILRRNRVHPQSLQECLKWEEWDRKAAWETSSGLKGTTVESIVDGLKNGEHLLLVDPMFLRSVSRIRGTIVATSRLSFQNCSDLEFIEGKVIAFEELNFTNCPILKRVTGRCCTMNPKDPTAKSGTTMTFQCCPALESLENLEPLAHASLYVSGIDPISSWARIMLPSSRLLEVLSGPNLKSLGTLSGTFGHLQVSACPLLQSLPEGPFDIEEVHLEDCPQLESLGGLTEIGSGLTVRNCPGVLPYLNQLMVERRYQGPFDLPKHLPIRG